MTDTNDKLRGLFLAALMVMSVFAMTVAFSGSVAAANNAVDIDRVNVVDASGVSNDAIDTMLSTSIDSDDDVVEVRFNRTLADVNPNGATSITDWYVEYEDGDQEEANTVLLGSDDSQTSTDGTTVTMVFDTGFSGDVFNVTDIVLKDDAAVTTTNAPGNPNTLNTDEEVDNIATAGVAEANTNKSAWIGETVAIIGDDLNEDVFIQRKDTTFVSSPAAADNNQIVIFDSEGREAGEYHVDFDGGETLTHNPATDDEVAIKLRDLGLEIEADDTSIDDQDDAEATVSAATGDRSIRVGVREDDGDFVSGLNDTVDLDPSTEQDFNFGTLDDGTYTYYVEDLTTGITAESDEVDVTETDEDVSFNQSTYTDQRGDVVNITIDFTEEDVATVNIGPYDDTGYGANVTVEEDSDDEQVTLQWNTWLVDESNDPDEFTVADDDDSVLNVQDYESDVAGPNDDDIINPGIYDLDVRVGDDPEVKADDVAVVNLESRNTTTVNTWTLPDEEAGDVSDKEDVYDRIGINITQDSTIADGDVMISQIVASGLQGAIVDEDPNDPSMAFDDLETQQNVAGEDDVFSLRLQQTNANLNQAPEETDYSDAWDDDAVSVIDDPNNDTYFVVWDLSALSSGTLDPEDGDQFKSNFTVFSYEDTSTDYGLVGPDADGDFEDEEVTSPWTFVDAEMEINTDRGDLVRVRAQANQTIDGTSSLATGSEHDIRVQTVQGASNAFLLLEDVTVENGTWSADFNFSGKQVGTEFEVTADDTVADNEEEDGIIQGEPIVQALTFEDQDSGGGSVVVQEAQLSDGGFIAIHEGSASGDVLGTTRYIEPGEEAENLGVGLSSDVSDGDTLVAMPHLDTDSNERYTFPDGDGPYTENGSPVTESATISVVSQQPTPTPQVITPTPMETPTPQVVTRTVMVTPDETPGQDGPGFGVVVALIALIAAALLAVRRNN